MYRIQLVSHFWWVWIMEHEVDSLSWSIKSLENFYDIFLDSENSLQNTRDKIS